ncbi:type IV pilin protein [Halopseudomonas sp.]|uniref:type IV pilin protein n=1 Tax=Halopseudomonas sp. TaxID=2901191 RepID=UPI003563C522
MNTPKQPGFTLIELIIVVAIIAILAAIAYPSYQEQVRQARRAEVTGVLLENAQLLERHFTRHGAYDTGALVLATQSPASGTAVYRVAVVRGLDTYTLTATAASGGVMAGDTCASYTFNQTGQRTPADARCWRR